MTSCWLYIVSTGWWNTQRACFLFLPLTGAGAGERRINAMNDYTDELDNTIEQTEEMLTYEVSDEALEAAAGSDGYSNVTERFTAWGVNNCLLC